jgi:hypothetical protein
MNELARLYDELPLQASHHFQADSEKAVNVLKQLLNITGQMSASLDAHASAPYADQKLVSLLRQHTNIAQSVYQV